MAPGPGRPAVARGAPRLAAAPSREGAGAMSRALMVLLGATSATVVITGVWDQLEGFRQRNRSDAAFTETDVVGGSTPAGAGCHGSSGSVAPEGTRRQLEC